MSFWDASPEGAVEFYEFLFSLGQDYGMFSYEPDFLNANHLCVPRFIEEVGAADAFFGAQAGVALARGIPIQWCFCTPMLLMWTLKAPAVTNFRVSYDFYYGGSWDTGRSSLIVWAMGKAPSKDTFWTTEWVGESSKSPRTRTPLNPFSRPSTVTAIRARRVAAATARAARRTIARRPPSCTQS